MFADAFIHINVGELNITLAQIALVATSVSAAVTGVAKLIFNYLRERDAREILSRQQVYELGMAQAKAGDKQATSVIALAEKAK